MLPSVVEIASPGLYLSKNRGFLSVKGENGHQDKVPLDNIGVLVLSSPQATLSTALMNTLSERGIVTVLCDQKHRPASYLYPYKTHMELTGRLLDQIKARKPLKKRLWQSVVQSKIFHQAYVLADINSPDKRRLEKLATEVSSGDKENREAQAARIYWQALMGSAFRRKPRGDGWNNLLDFGYGILRSSILRAIAGSGLNPSLGLAHISRRNPFCLADDLVEPFRPLVDTAVYYMKSIDQQDLNPKTKGFLAGVLALDMQMSKGLQPVIRSMSGMAQSLARSFEQGEPLLEIPVMVKDFYKRVIKLWEEMGFS